MDFHAQEWTFALGEDEREYTLKILESGAEPAPPPRKPASAAKKSAAKKRSKAARS
jgi:hypothetical protein